MSNPSNLGSPVVTRTISWTDLVIRAWGPEWKAPDHDVYKFSNGKGYDSTDLSQGGVYDLTQNAEILLDDPRYPDMASDLLAENGQVIAAG